MALYEEFAGKGKQEKVATEAKLSRELWSN